MCEVFLSVGEWEYLGLFFREYVGLGMEFNL